MAMVPGHCRPAIGFEYSSHTCDAQTSIACSAPSKKREGPFLHAILAFPPFSSTVCALLASARAGCVCASSSPPFLTGGAPRQCIWPVAHGKGALSPLLPLPFPHLPLFTVICRPHPPPRRSFAPATSLVFKRVDDVHNWHPPLHGNDCLFHSWCYLLMFGDVQWWTTFRLRQWNCAMMISYFTLPWFLLSALVLWWQCHYILAILVFMCYSVCVGSYVLCVRYWAWCLCLT
jgi:hypothetical protein